MKQWYIVQLVAGNEEKVKNEIEKRVFEKKLSDFFDEVFIPKLKKDEKDSIKDNKLNFIDSMGMFPGYILVKIEATLEMLFLIQSVDKVIKFLGGNNPTPLEEKEFNKILSQINGEEKVVHKVEQDFEIGREVDILSGPFINFVGKINFIDEEKKRLTVMISIFGRLTSVDISFDQVKKI